MGLFDWVNNCVEDLKKESNEMAFEASKAQAEEAQRSAAQEQLQTIQARMANIQTTLDGYNHAIDSLQNFALTVESVFEDYSGYLGQYPNNTAVKNEIIKKIDNYHSMLVELPDDFDFDFVVKDSDISLLDDAQKKEVYDLAAIVDKVDPNEFGRRKQACAFGLDKMAQLVLFGTVKTQPELAYRSDGSLFPFVPENVNQVLKPLREAAQKEKDLAERKEFEEKLIEALNRLSDSVDFLKDAQGRSENAASGGIGLKEIAIAGFSFNAFKDFVWRRDRDFAKLLADELKRR